MAEFALNRVASAPGKMLERLQGVFQQNTFDTSGPNDDVLKLLLACCKTLVDVVTDQSNVVQRLQEEASTVSSLRARILRADEATNMLEQMSQRVSFLWAAQGLGDFALDIHGKMAAQPQSNLSAVPPPSLSMAASPSGMGAGNKNFGGGATTTGFTPASRRRDKEVGEATMQRLAVDDALRKSLDVSAKLDEHVRQMGEEAHVAVVEDRLALVERAAEGLYRTSCKAQTELSRLSEAALRVDQQQQALEHRLTIHGDLLTKLGEATATADNRIANTVEQTKARVTELESATGDLRNTLQTTIRHTQATTAELATLRETRLSHTDAKGLIARGVTAGIQPVVDELQALRTILDIPKEDVQRVAATAIATLVAPVTQAMAAATVPGKLPLVSHQPQVDPQDCLRVCHAALPFKTVLAAVQRVNENVKQLREQQQSMIARARPTQPLLGLELADSVDGVTVARVFPSLPAAAAGLKQGDIIVAVQGTTVRSRDDFSAAFSQLIAEGGTMDNKVLMHIRRASKLQELKVGLS